MIPDNPSDVEPDVPPAALAVMGKLNALAKAARDKHGSGHTFSPYDLRTLLPKLTGWPFAPDDPRATALVEWLAGHLVHDLITSALESDVLRQIRAAVEDAWIKAIHDRYAIPEFTLRAPWLHLPPQPNMDRYHVAEDDGAAYRVAYRAWKVKCDRLTAENVKQTAEVAAAKQEHAATYDGRIEQRAAEIAAARELFPASEWQRLIADLFRARAVARYRDVNGEPEFTEYAPPIVAGFLRPGEPGVIGAPQKTGKTLLGIELAAALATGTPFLGMAIPKPVGVWVLTKETPAAYWRDLFVRAVRSRGRDPKEALARLMLTTDIEATRDKKKRDELTSYLCRSGTKVAILDPLYKIRPQCSSADLTAEGAVLDELALPFTEAGCCPVLVHHFTKHTPIGQWPTLEDLTGAAVGPFARSWCLLNRRTEYAGDGRHELFALTGSSAGDFGRLRIDLDERDWSVAVVGGPDARSTRRATPAYLTQDGATKTARRPARKG